MSDLEAFHARLHRMVDAAAGAVSADAEAAVRRLIDHDEGGLALLTLAEAVIEHDGRLSPHALGELRELTDGYGLSDELPPDLDARVA